MIASLKGNLWKEKKSLSNFCQHFIAEAFKLNLQQQKHIFSSLEGNQGFNTLSFLCCTVRHLYNRKLVFSRCIYLIFTEIKRILGLKIKVIQHQGLWFINSCLPVPLIGYNLKIHLVLSLIALGCRVYTSEMWITMDNTIVARPEEKRCKAG